MEETKKKSERHYMHSYSGDWLDCLCRITASIHIRSSIFHSILFRQRIQSLHHSMVFHQQAQHQQTAEIETKTYRRRHYSRQHDWCRYRTPIQATTDNEQRRDTKRTNLIIGMLIYAAHVEWNYVRDHICVFLWIFLVRFPRLHNGRCK